MSREPLDVPADAAGEMMRRLGIEWLEVAPDRVMARIPVDGNTQPYGILHGGATAALCETVASFGAAINAGAERVVMGVELNVNHLRAARDGHITASGRPVHQGRTMAVWTMEVHDDDGRLVAVGRLTLAVRERVPG
jgi:uncharacterized protein (TIGR00369 family)